MYFSWKNHNIIEMRRLKILLFFRNCCTFFAVQKNYYHSYIDFFSFHTKLFAQKFWKRTCLGFEPVTPLNDLICGFSLKFIFARFFYLFPAKTKMFGKIFLKFRGYLCNLLFERFTTWKVLFFATLLKSHFGMGVLL